MKQLTILFLFAANGLSPRPIGFFIPDLFGSAKFVGEVVITNYDGEGKIFFQSTQFKDTINNASCGQKIKNGVVFPNLDKDYWTCNMPFIGDTVLVVVDGYNRTSVFGKRIGSNYRLWSTLYSGSIAIFRFEKPVAALDKGKFIGNDSATSCWDGCLVPAKQLSELIRVYKKRFSQKVNSVNIQNYIDKEALYIFYNDTLRLFDNIVWTDEPPGRLKSLILTYSNKKALEIIPLIGKDEPAQFDENKMFDMEKFKKMKIKEIRWTTIWTFGGKLKSSPQFWE